MNPTEHKCGKKWAKGAPVDCDRCRPPAAKSPTYLKEGYKKSTRTNIKDRRGSREVEHWSGRQDAEIRPSPARGTAKPKEY
jgi:hypothetical protein